MSYTISKDFAFSASHLLRGLPEDHPCGRLHGHNYAVRVELTGDLDSAGFVVDYGALAPYERWLKQTVDHRHLNELEFFDGDRGGVNPTAENLSRFLTAGLHTAVRVPRSVFAKVCVSETPKTWAAWNPG